MILRSHYKLKNDNKKYQWIKEKINYALLHLRAINSYSILKYYRNLYLSFSLGTRLSKYILIFKRIFIKIG